MTGAEDKSCAGTGGTSNQHLYKVCICVMYTPEWKLLKFNMIFCSLDTFVLKKITSLEIVMSKKNYLLALKHAQQP